jgi:hypothetical protein
MRVTTHRACLLYMEYMEHMEYISIDSPTKHALDLGIHPKFYYWVGWGWKQIANQYVWLENDLMEAARPVRNFPCPTLLIVVSEVAMWAITTHLAHKLGRGWPP